MTLALAVIAGLAAGLVLGAGHAAALRWNVRLYLAAGRPGRAIALHVLRFVAVAAGMWLAARQGAGALLAAAAGFTMATIVAARRAAWRGGDGKR
jgi:F1F0 ATPase subunit 2